MSCSSAVINYLAASRDALDKLFDSMLMARLYVKIEGKQKRTNAVFIKEDIT